MLERVLLVMAFVIVVPAAALIVRSVARRRVATAQGHPLPAELQARFAGAGPGIVYFFGPHCRTCRQQAAVLDQLSTTDRVTVVRLDATKEPALADALAVATVPTTVIVDGARSVRAINLGFQSRDALEAQLREHA